MEPAADAENGKTVKLGSAGSVQTKPQGGSYRFGDDSCEIVKITSVSLLQVEVNQLVNKSSPNL